MRTDEKVRRTNLSFDENEIKKHTHSLNKKYEKQKYGGRKF